MSVPMVIDEVTNSNSMGVNGSLHSERVAILDAGAQYGKVIDRRVRELNVESVMVPLNTSWKELSQGDYKALIISGGPGSVTDNPLPYDPEIFASGLPILGICYGCHMINKEYAGSVEKKAAREDGQFKIEVDLTSKLFKGCNQVEEVLLTHGYSISKIADGFKCIAKSGDIVAAISNENLNLYGVQFHPEVDLSSNGKVMMKNFLYDIAGCKGTFTMKSREEECLEYIRQAIGSNKVLMLVSGGVDSTVCAALLHRALQNEDQVIAYHIDNGFMRKNESEAVEQSLKNLGLKLKVVSAGPLFYNSTTTVPVDKKEPNRKRVTKVLCQVTDPEEKRKIIGDTFVRVAEDLIQELKLNPDDVYLGQGTLRPDLIESASHLASSNADAIKTHHNDTELVRQLRAKGRVVEPLRDFHKDEVRVLGRDLGLPSELVQRHPFPGPGLAVRVICADEPFMEKDFSETQVLVKVICNYKESLERKHALINRVQGALSAEDQEFLLGLPNSPEERMYPTLLPIKSVGVQGDCRTYSYVVALSGNKEPTDWSDWMRLAKVIPRVCHNVNRVCYAFGKPIQFPVQDVTPTLLSRQVLSTLREADNVAQTILRESGHHASVAQMPIVLIPIHFDRDVVSRQPSCQRSIVIRTFITHDFMTGIPAEPNKHIPLDVVNKMAQELEQIPGISRVLYDLTPKPPGTTEWE